jgi:hypothetical protein
MGTDIRRTSIMARKTERKYPPREYIPYQNNPNVVVYYELQVGRDLMVPKTKFKKKYDRDIYQFLCLAHHIPNDNTWVDAYSVTRGSRHSIRVEDIQRVVKPKRSRRKKVE